MSQGAAVVHNRLHSCYSTTTVPGSSWWWPNVDVHVRLDCTNLQDIEMTMSQWQHDRSSCAFREL